MNKLEQFHKFISRDSMLLIIALLALLSIAYAYFYLQLTLYLMPCVMCVTQRYLLALFALTLVFAYLFRRSYKVALLFHGLGGIAIVTNSYVAGRQVWLQSLPEDQVPACGSSFNWMLQTSDFGRLIQSMFVGDGNCADVDWMFLGLSIPSWVLVVSIILLLIQCNYVAFNYKNLKNK